MVLLCGIPSESPVELVRRELDTLNVRSIMFNQRRFASTELQFELRTGRVSGELTIEGQAYDLEEISGVYIRMMDAEFLPELHGEPSDSPVRHYCRWLHAALMRWAEITPARVIDRAAGTGSNRSKPYQAQLIRQHGFLIPETLITNDPELVLEFRRLHGSVIYKSMSSRSSIVQLLEERDIARLHRIRWCPTQFQQFVDGLNVRVHIVDTAVFATAIHSNATDYRSAIYQVGKPAELMAYQLPESLAERCVQLSRALGLVVAGIDLKITQDNEVFCFEVNPGPAFSYYEWHTGQPIGRAIAHYLARGYV